MRFIPLRVVFTQQILGQQRTSLDSDDVFQFPRLVEKSLRWSVEPEDRKPAFSGTVLIQLPLPFGSSGPNTMSIDPSALVLGFVYTLTEGNG